VWFAVHRGGRDPGSDAASRSPFARSLTSRGLLSRACSRLPSRVRCPVRGSSDPPKGLDGGSSRAERVGPGLLPFVMKWEHP
jgi:hypothetical protein